MNIQFLENKADTSKIINDLNTKQSQINLKYNQNIKSKIQDDRIESMIKSYLQQSYCKQPIKLKSKSLATLNTSIANRNKNPQQMRQRRYSDKRQEMNEKINGLEKQCQKYGGADFMKAQLIRNKITRQQQLDYYKQKIQSIHGSLSLPRIQRIRGQPKSQNNHQNSAINRVKAANRYNKWYIEPSKRFSPEELESKYSKQSNITKYVQKMLSSSNKNVKVKFQNAPDVIREWSLKLGRDPLICSYAQINRR